MTIEQVVWKGIEESCWHSMKHLSGMFGSILFVKSYPGHVCCLVIENSSDAIMTGRAFAKGLKSRIYLILADEE